MEYELYHDESKEGGFWHGMLLVPVGQKDRLIALLAQARELARYESEIGLKKVKKEGKIFACASAFTQVGVAALLQNLKGQHYPIDLGRRERNQPVLDVFKEAIGAKFILFREKNDHALMQGHKDYGSKVETSMRMGIKGGIHFLGDAGSPIHITKLHFDNHEHYQRRLDKTRIVHRLHGLRDYCSFTDAEDLIDDRGSNHEKDNCQEYGDCQLLQLTDLLVGGFRTVLGNNTNVFQKKVAEPVRRIADRYRQGHARMKNSRWFKGFCLSQCSLQDGKWRFEEVEDASEKPQTTLF